MRILAPRRRDLVRSLFVVVIVLAGACSTLTAAAARYT